MAVEVIDVTLPQNTDNRPKILNSYLENFQLFQISSRSKVI